MSTAVAEPLTTVEEQARIAAIAAMYDAGVLYAMARVEVEQVSYRDKSRLEYITEFTAAIEASHRAHFAYLEAMSNVCDTCEVAYDDVNQAIETRTTRQGLVIAR